MNKDQVIGRKICLLLISKDNQGDDDWAIALGEITFINGTPHFQNTETPKPFVLPDDTLERLLVPSEEVRNIVCGADYILPLPVKSIPEGPNAEPFVPTGLKWPE